MTAKNELALPHQRQGWIRRVRGRVAAGCLSLGLGLIATPFVSHTVLADGRAPAALERPPYMQVSPGGTEPLIAIFSFLSRSDNTPLEARPRGAHNTVGPDGMPIADPADPGAVNAFEADPNINFEKWGAYWRKVHGVRFTYTEEASDESLSNLLRYDQLHRTPGGPTRAVAPPYAAPADAAGRLFPGVIGHIPVYQRPLWDGVAYLQFKDLEAIGAVFASEKFQKKIVPEDFALFREVAPMLSRQIIMVPSATGRDPVSLVVTHARKPGLSREDFQSWWRDEGGAALLGHPAAQRYVKAYVQLHNIGPSQSGQPFYNAYTAGLDGVSLLSFASMNDVEDFLIALGPSAPNVLAGEMAEADKTAFWTSINYNVVTRVFPQPATN